MAQHIRKNDVVMVIAGDDRNRTGKVLRVLPSRGLVLVEGVNVRRKHIKRNQKQPQGGIIEKEMPISMSRVQPLVDGKATRVRFQAKADGTKLRVAVRGGEPIGQELFSPRKK